MKLNRKWLLIIALVMSLTMATAGTLAYLTDHDSEVNTFTLGNVDIDLIETYTPNSQLNPGVAVTKEATIKNVHATEPAYVWMVVSVPEDLAKHITLGWANGYTGEEITDTDLLPYDGYKSFVNQHRRCHALCCSYSGRCRCRFL